MQAITPFLWFDTQAEEAAERYVSVFAKLGRPGETRVRGVTRYGEAGPGTPGSAMTVQFVLDGQEFTALMELLSDPDPERSGRAMRAMLQMRKIDIAELRRAAEAPHGS